MFNSGLFEQQIQQLQQQHYAIEQAIIEITGLNLGLDDLTGSKGKEILAPIGKGIFVKTKLLSEELILDIGGGNFVKKSIPETKKIIKGQIKKLEEIRKELEENLEKASEELTKRMIETQKREKKKKGKIKP